MDDFVGVNPANLEELTKRLHRLHEVLSRNGPLIRQTMQQWGSEVGFAPLTRLTEAAMDDARDMRRVRHGRVTWPTRKAGIRRRSDPRGSGCSPVCRRDIWISTGPPPGRAAPRPYRTCRR